MGEIIWILIRSQTQEEMEEGLSLLTRSSFSANLKLFVLQSMNKNTFQSNTNSNESNRRPGANDYKVSDKVFRLY